MIDEQSGLQALYQDDDLRLTGVGPLFRDGHDGGELTISFTGVGAGMDAVQDDEFRRTARQGDRSALFVTDKTRSWFNTPGLYERILDLTAPWRQRAGDLITLGNSMGGSGALLFAAPMGARVALSFGPQVSISRRVIPQETRWSQFVSRIADIRFEDLNDALGEGPAYVVFHGSGGKDAYHIEALRPRPNLTHYVIVDGPHSVGAAIRDQGLLGPLVAAVAEGDWAGLDRLARLAGAAPRAETGSAITRLEARRARRRAAARS